MKMTKERVYVSPLEIKLFCNVYYDEEEGICGTVIRRFGDKAEVMLDREINIRGHLYQRIFINNKVKDMTEDEIQFSLDMQKAYFDKRDKLN
jgi:hypothetical protein